MTKVLVATAAVALVLAVAAQPAEAVCGAARQFSSSGIVFYGNYSYIYSVGIGAADTPSSVTSNLGGFFWGLGDGNPAIGAGQDNGTWVPLENGGYGGSGWIYYYPGYAAVIEGTWAATTQIDGCIDFAPGDRCMAILLHDQFEGVGYWGLFTDAPNANINFDFGETIGAGAVQLGQIPKPIISGSTRVDTSNVMIDVAPPDLSGPNNGLFLDPVCGAGMIQGYKLYTRTIGRGAADSPDRDVNTWDLAVNTTPLDQPAQIMGTCSGDSDILISTTVVFDSGFELPVTSESSTRVQCGPTLAEPDDRRPVRPIGVQKGEDAPARRGDVPTRRGGR